MEFRTKYNRLRKLTNAGSPFLNTYKQTVDDDGKIILVKSGKDNIYEKIQAERSSCELKQILARLSHDEMAKFDISRGGLFGDFTNVPKSIREMRERMLEAESMFSTLPAEVKEKFGFSADRFFSSIGTDFYKNVMDPYINPVEVKKEVNEEVEE